MIPYYCDEAMIELPRVRSLVDRTRQHLHVVTEDDAEIELVIERAAAPTDQTLHALVEARVAERRRSLRGFELLSWSERQYPAILGIEVRSTWVDKERGPRFVHELHCAMHATWMSWQGACRLPHTALCDAWMQSVLASIQLR